MSFESMHYNIADQSAEELVDVGVHPRAFRGVGLRGGTDVPKSGSDFTTEEGAARFYLSRLFERSEQSAFRGLASTEQPAAIPDMRLRDSTRSPITRTWTVRFSQVSRLVPIFGSHVAVELDRDRLLLSVDGRVAEVKNVSPIASVSPAEALAQIAALALVDVAKLSELAAPELVYCQDGRGVWRLAFHVRLVPAAPPDFMQDSQTHGLGPSLAQHHPRLDYLVDAHNAEVLRYWSSVPTISKMPSLCNGLDEEGVTRTFYGQQMDASSWIMSDPMRMIQTCDMALNDIDNDTVPTDAIHANTPQFDSRAAVSAHVNATTVDAFFRSVLIRNGIDDKGMRLVSYVNCTLPALEQPPQWRNAAWYNHRMWYGQHADSTGALRSFSRYLDVIAHELTHGVTEFTADLAYMDQSGALNESFSDIFAIIIKNWDPASPGGGVVSSWNWEIGSGLGENGMPLRDFQDPTRTGDPDHMSKYNATPRDNGGVHTNSNIHNKAAYLVLSARDAAGDLVFIPRDIAVLYYLCLTRLYRLATFVQVRDTLLNAAGTYYAGLPSREEKLRAITAAYAEVGI